VPEAIREKKIVTLRLISQFSSLFSSQFSKISQKSSGTGAVQKIRHGKRFL